MIPIKTSGRIVGAKFTRAEQKAFDIEAQRQLSALTEAHARELDAIILWALHTRFGFGKKRLRDFYGRYHAEAAELAKRYEMGKPDEAWLCTHKLKEIGVDLDKWRRETDEKTTFFLEEAKDENYN